MWWDDNSTTVEVEIKGEMSSKMSKMASKKMLLFYYDHKQQLQDSVKPAGQFLNPNRYNSDSLAG